MCKIKMKNLELTLLSCLKKYTHFCSGDSWLNCFDSQLWRKHLDQCWTNKRGNNYSNLWGATSTNGFMAKNQWGGHLCNSSLGSSGKNRDAIYDIIQFRQSKFYCFDKRKIISMLKVKWTLTNSAPFLEWFPCSWHSSLVHCWKRLLGQQCLCIGHWVAREWHTYIGISQGCCTPDNNPASWPQRGWAQVWADWWWPSGLFPLLYVAAHKFWSKFLFFISHRTFRTIFWFFIPDPFPIDESSYQSMWSW